MAFRGEVGPREEEKSRNEEEMKEEEGEANRMQSCGQESGHRCPTLQTTSLCPALNPNQFARSLSLLRDIIYFFGIYTRMHIGVSVI